jgi:flagellar biosynthetic protein FliR
MEPNIAASLGEIGSAVQATGAAGLAGAPEILGYHLLLVFARLGTAMMLLPGIGEMWVTPRVRLAFALAFSVIVMSFVGERLPPPPAAAAHVLGEIGHEVLIGLFFGFCVRAAITSLMIAGSVIALQAGLANALQPGVVTPDASTIMGVFLALAAIALIANTGLDHLLLSALVQTYDILPPPDGGFSLPTEDMLQIAVRTVAEGFAVGLKIAMPVLVATLILNLGLGLANRFMPQLQAYFVSQPLAILISVSLLMLTAATMFDTVRDMLQATLARLGGVG